VTDEEQLKYLKALTLLVIEQGELSLALMLVLRAHNLLDQHVLDVALIEARKHWLAARQAVQNEEDPTSLLELLRSYKGPIQ
jgi:hypothetical protein